MGQDKHHDIDKLFQDAFQSHEAAPPFNMWNKIEGSLPLSETDLIFKRAFDHYEKATAEPKALNIPIKDFKILLTQDSVHPFESFFLILSESYHFVLLQYSELKEIE